MVDNIKFPTIELTDWVFEGEKIFFGEMKWESVHHLKEKYIERQYSRILVDSDGNILKVTNGQIIGKKKFLFSFIIPPTLSVNFDLSKTGRTISLDDLKRKILYNKNDIFHLTHNKLMTIEDFEKKINASKTYEEVINIATFLDEDE